MGSREGPPCALHRSATRELDSRAPASRDSPQAVRARREGRTRRARKVPVEDRSGDTPIQPSSDRPGGADSVCLTLFHACSKRAREAKCATVHPDWQAERPPEPRSCPFHAMLCVSRGAACGDSDLYCARLHRTLHRTVHGLSFCSFDSAPIFGAFVHSAIQPPNESGSIFLSSSRRVLSTCRSESNEPTRRANCSQWGMSTERITRLMSGI